MNDPFQPKSDQLIREAKIGLTICGLLVVLFVYVAWNRFSGNWDQVPEHVAQAPLARNAGDRFRDELKKQMAALEDKPRDGQARVNQAESLKSDDDLGKAFEPGSVANAGESKPLPQRNFPLESSPRIGDANLEKTFTRGSKNSDSPNQFDQADPKSRFVVKHREPKTLPPITFNALRNQKPDKHVDSDVKMAGYEKPLEKRDRQPARNQFQGTPRVNPSERDERIRESNNGFVPNNTFKPKTDFPPSENTKPNLEDSPKTSSEGDSVLLSRSGAPTVYSQRTTFQVQVEPAPENESTSNLEYASPTESKLTVGETQLTDQRTTIPPSPRSIDGVNHIEGSNQSKRTNMSSTTDSGVAPGRYLVQQGDGSLWNIAQKVYDDGRLFRAIYEINKHTIVDANQLPYGKEIQVPPIEELVSKWSEFVPEDLRPANSDESANIYVTREGDTLFHVARQQLGQAYRFDELLTLNRGRLPLDTHHLKPLPAGMRLELPSK